jgi:protease-4
MLNLLTLLLIAAIIGAFLAQIKHPRVPANAALLLDPHGPLIYHSSSSWERRLAIHLRGAPASGVLVRHMVEAIDHAAHDPRIRLLALNLSSFGGGSITQLETVARALRRFRASGKPIYAYAPTYPQGAYLLASQADHVYMSSLGQVFVTGFSAHQLYFRHLLDKLGVTFYAFRKGKYKSAVEPMTRTEMSPAAQIENRAWLAVWWNTYANTVASGRGLLSTRIKDYANALPRLLEAAQGDAARLALKQKLITHIGDAQSFQRALATAMKQPVNDLSTIGLHDYLTATHRPSTAKATIAVVPIDGMLLPGGDRTPGTVAAQLTADQLLGLADEANVKAVVLQVNSPGGSVTAAQDIREAILTLRKAGKPVVVSMGTLGASGAYWLSSAADRIYAHPTTLTADIGVFALLPNYSGVLDKLDIGYSGVGTTSNAGTLSPFAPLTTNDKRAMQAVVDHLYGRFVHLVADSRRLSPAQAEQSAQGRAWSGLDAKRLGLVDALGGMPQAIAASARLAQLKSGDYRVDYLATPGTLRPLTMVRQFGLSTLISGLMPVSELPVPAANGLDQVRLLLGQSHPYGLFSYLPVAPLIH